MQCFSAERTVEEISIIAEIRLAAARAEISARSISWARKSSIFETGMTFGRGGLYNYARYWCYFWWVVLFSPFYRPAALLARMPLMPFLSHAKQSAIMLSRDEAAAYYFAELLRWWRRLALGHRVTAYGLLHYTHNLLCGKREQHAPARRDEKRFERFPVRLRCATPRFHFFRERTVNTISRL